MVFRHPTHVLLLGGMTLGAAWYAEAQVDPAEGAGQASTRISEPLGAGGPGEGRSTLRSDIDAVDPRMQFGSGSAVGSPVPGQPGGQGGLPVSPGPGTGAGLPDIGLDGERPPQAVESPPGFSPLFPADIPSALDPGFIGGGPGLLPDQLENLGRYEEQLLPTARLISDPAERSLALNRIAESQIRGGQYDEARVVLEEASQAALEMPAGIVRELRLISVAQTFVTLAHNRVVEAVPTISPVASLLVPRFGARMSGDRARWLERSVAEFARAAELVGAVQNENYRSEHLASVVQAQAVDSMKICNDASQADAGRSDVGPSASELLSFADQLLVQATRHAAAIDRAVWQDQAMVVLTIAAARSNQFARAISVARDIPRPEARAEALTQVAESMARLAALFRVQYGEGLERSWQSLASGIEAAGALPPPSAAQPEDFGIAMARQNLIDELLFRIEGHDQLARALRRVADQILLQLNQNETVRARIRSTLVNTPSLIASVEALGRAADELSAGLAELRAALADRRGAGQALDLGPPAQSLPQAIPGLDDPRVVAIREQSDRINELLENLALPFNQAATPTYEEAARAVASVRESDPRANAVYLLVDSLTAVGRFRDARAAAQLIPAEDQRYVVLAQVAESQGRRGLPEEAREWIAREVPAARRDELYRSVQQGVLSSLDQLRSRAIGGYPRPMAGP